MSNSQFHFRDYKPPAQTSDRFASYFVFLFWPLLGTILSFRHYKFNNSRNVIWLFNIFVGLTFGFAEGTDSTRYKKYLEILYNKRTYTLSEFWTYLLGEDSGSIDIFQPLVNFLVSRVTDNGYVLFGVYGFIFGYFYSRNLWFLVDKVKGKIKWEALSFLVLFAFLVPFWSINGFRFWTATHVFLYGLIQFLNGDKKKIIFVFLPILIHYTFIFPTAIFLGYILAGNRLRIYFIIYCTSIFMTFIDIGVVGVYLESLNSEKLTERASGYVSEEYAEGYFESMENTRWYVKYRYDFIKLLVAGSFFWVFFARQKLIYQNPLMLKLFCVGLLYMAFANVTASVPSMLRFYYIGFMPVTAMLFLFFQLLKFKRRPDWYKITSVLFAFLFCLVELRVGLSNMTIATAIANPFTIGLFDRTVTLLEFIKGVK